MSDMPPPMSPLRMLITALGALLAAGVVVLAIVLAIGLFSIVVGGLLTSITS